MIEYVSDEMHYAVDIHGQYGTFPGIFDPKQHISSGLACVEKHTRNIFDFIARIQKIFEKGGGVWEEMRQKHS